MRDGSIDDDDAGRSGPDLVEALRRWEVFGAVWRVLGQEATGVTVGLFRCDAGEEVSRFTSAEPELLEFLDERAR
jgi:hypothetical protein